MMRRAKDDARVLGHVSLVSYHLDQHLHCPQKKSCACDDLVQGGEFESPDLDASQLLARWNLGISLTTYHGDRKTEDHNVSHKPGDAESHQDVQEERTHGHFGDGLPDLEEHGSATE